MQCSCSEDKTQSEQNIMDRENKKPHILVLTYLLQGHLNPLLQFSKRLASKGLLVTLIIPSSTKKFSIDDSPASSNIRVEQIPDGIMEGEKLSIDEHLERFDATVAKTLNDFIERSLQSECPPKALVYDAGMPWALDVAMEHGLLGAPFFTQACMVNAIYYLLHQGVQNPLHGSVGPLMEVLEDCDLPTFLTRDIDVYPVLMKVVVGQFSNIKKANWVFVNSFMELEEEVAKWMNLQCPTLTIGPTIPSMYMDKRLEDDRDYGLSLIKSDGHEAYMKWLNSKKPGSVIYVSFGSMAALGEDQMEEIAWGLKNSNLNFLWIVRESEKTKLPLNFLDETSEKGLVMSWCSQLQVLSHEAIGCFVTHCGWNSTLESLSLGVPMVAMPQWSDQPTNAKLIVDMWKVGMRVRVDEKGIGRRDEVERCVKTLIEGEKGKVLKKNSLKYRELAKQAVGKGGSSDNNIDAFIAKILSAA